MSLTVNSRPATWAGTSGPIIYKMTTTDHANAGYYLLVEIWNSTTGLKIGTQKCYPNSAGLLSVRVEAILKSNMSLDNNSDLTTGSTVYLDGNWIKYYIKYQEFWTGSATSNNDDVANLRFAIYGGLQLGVTNDLTSYVNTKFLNISGQAIVNYPFLIESIIDVTSNVFSVSKFKNSLGIGLSEYTLSSAGVNRFKIKESTADLVKLGLGNYGAWTSRTSASDINWRSVTFGNNIFVAVASAGASTSNVMTSPNGTTWTIRTSAAGISWESVCFGNGLFVAVSTSGTGNRVMTSPDGITWTSRTSAADNDWISVAYGNGLFVAVSQTGTGNRCMVSIDGIIWTLGVTSDNTFRSVTFGNGLFVAVSSNGTNRVITSSNGLSWIEATSPVLNNWVSVTFGSNLFVAVSNSGTGDRVMTSPDGINWVTRTNPVDNSWTSVCFGGTTFVSVANTGTGNRVMTSVSSFYETKSITIQPELSNTVMLQWKNSLGGDECYPFTYNQEYTFDYGGGKKAKRLTLFAHGLTLSQWEAINGLNTLGEPYKTPITEMTTSINRTMATIGQSVYILNSDGTKIGVTVINVQNTTQTKKVQHEATVTIEYPEIFLQ